MAEIASAYVSLLASGRGMGASIRREIDPEMSKAGKRGGGLLAAGLKSAIGPAVALLGTAAVGSFLKDSIGEAREAQKVGALTTNVIKQTGGAANISAKQVGDLATAISLKTGVDDEAIQSGANLLLTFKNVANQAGKNNKIFDRATQAAADLSAAGFGDLAGTSKQLGKALNDPIKGMSALGRSGVTFTDAQKKQIKGMVEQGDLLGAQKVLLREVESQVGGAAAASATSGEKAAVAFGNLKEAIGTALLPVVDKVANYLVSTFIPALYKIPAVFAQVRAYLAPAITLFQAFFQRLTSGSGQTGARFEQFKVTAIAAFASVKATFASAVSIISSLWNAFGSTILRFANGTLKNLMNQIRGIFTVIQGIFQTFSALLRGDWKGVWDGVKTILRGAVTVLKAQVSQLWNTIRTVFSAGKTAVVAIVKGLGSGILSAASAGFGKLKAGAMAGWDSAKAYVKGLPEKIKTALGNLGTLLLDAGKSVITGLISGMTSKFGDLAAKAKEGANIVKQGVKGALRINSPSKVMIPIGAGIPEGLIVGMASGEGGLRKAAKSMSGRLAGEIQRGLSGGGSSGLSAYLKTVNKSITDSLQLRKTRPGMSKKERRQVADYNDAARKAIKTQKAAVDQLEKSLTRLGGRIDSARSKLQGLKDARASLADQTASSISGELDLTATGGKKLSFATVAANVSGLASRAKAFAGKLRALLKAGIPAGLVQEVASLGTVQGSSVADALLTGSKQQIGQLAADYKGVDTYSKQIGDVVAGGMYDAGIAAQQGILNGLLDDKAIQRAADRLAKKLTKEVKKSLGIKSPSKVFQNEIGRYLPAGVVAGIDDGQRALDQRVAGMVSVAKIGAIKPGDLGAGMGAQPLSAPLVLDGVVVGKLVQVAGQAARVEVANSQQQLEQGARWYLG